MSPPTSLNSSRTQAHSGAEPRSLSAILLGLTDERPPPLTIREISGTVSERSMGAVLAFFAALNLIPAPPGTSLILGLPIVIISLQLLLAHNSIWLPDRIASHVVQPATLAKLIKSIMPWLLRLESILKPRYWPFSKSTGQSVVGALGIFLGMIVVFPIPMGNAAPAFAVSLLAIALSERDGLWLAAGFVVAILATLLAGSIVAGAAFAASAAWHMAG